MVLPTYNRADVLPRAINSVLAQTYEVLELLVVDDGSTDDTREVVSRFDDERVVYLRHEENEGVGAARNTGISHARGEFIAFQDSDDEWHNEKLAAQMEVFETAPPEVGVVYTGFHQKYPDGSERYVPNEPREGDIHSTLLRHNFVSVQTTAVRSRCFDRVGGFDERMPRLVDWELWIRLSEQFEFRVIDAPLVTAYVRPDGISSDRIALAEARELLVEKHGNRFDEELLADHLFRAGHAALKAGRASTGREYLSSAVKTNPRMLYLGLLLLAYCGSNTYNLIYELYDRLNI